MEAEIGVWKKIRQIEVLQVVWSDAFLYHWGLGKGLEVKGQLGLLYKQ